MQAKPVGTLQTIVRRPIFRMAHGLTNTALALSPFTAVAEVLHRWIDTSNAKKTDL